MPDQFAVRGVDERNSEAIPISDTVGCSPRISFRLLEDVLRIDSHFLCFDKANELTGYDEGIVCRAAFGWEFFNGVMTERRGIHTVAVGDNDPALGAKFSVDPALAC